MRRRSYDARKQPKDRRKYGELEKRADLTQRLAKIKKQKEDIKNAKEEIRNKSGQEYFFGYHSVKKNGSDFYKIDNPTVDELKRMKIYIDNEIHRCEVKMKKYIPRPTNTHIRFESDGESDTNLFDFERNEEMRTRFKEYVKELEMKRNEVVEMMERMN